MRIFLLTGGLYLLAAMPLTAQEASDSTRLFAVPATTPAAPNMQQLFVGVADTVSAPLSSPVVGMAGAALVALCLSLMTKSAGNGTPGTLRSA